MEQEKPSESPPKKSNKPQMEKKRRERINNSLNELKSLVLGAMKKDASYYSKLEKADILEMAVDHVRNLQKQLRSGQTTDSDPMAKYRAGFVTCASEVAKLVMGFPELDEGVKFNVLKHLANCCTGEERGGPAENTSKTEIKNEQARTPERDVNISLGHYNKPASPLTSRSQVIDSRTIGEKRLAYQQICNRQSIKRNGFTPEINVPRNHHAVNSAVVSPVEQKNHQMKTDAKVISSGNNAIGWINANSRQVSSQGFKLPPKTYRPDGNLIKPVPQMPEKIFISNGIRFMPATVLVPVQVGYSHVDYKQTKLADEKSEVWRPWEKMGQIAKDSNMSNKNLVS